MALGRAEAELVAEFQNWPLALDLQTRLKQRKAPVRKTEPSDEARRLLQEWRDQSPFNKGDFFDRKLKQLGISEDQFLGLLDEDVQSLAQGLSDRPPWLTELTEAYANPGEEKWLSPGLGRVVDPLLNRYFHRMDAFFADLESRYPGSPVDAETLRPQLFRAVIDPIEGLLSRPVVLEMHVAKYLDQLHGETSRMRFINFVNDLARPERSSVFLEDYPVLAKILIRILDFWLRGCQEILERLAADWETIQSTFEPAEPPGRLLEITFGEGDSHRDGRTVSQLAFASGFRLVYKPRSLAIDLAFARFLEWFESKGASTQRAVRSLDRSDYGWSEFMGVAHCRNKEEMQRFYLRQGEMLALLHALRAHDFHRENLIAVGEYPVLIDLETLFGPDFGRADPTTYPSRAAFELGNSVTRVMLLPFLQEGSRDQSLETSGLGGQEGQETLLPQPTWENLGTDEMRLVRKPSPLPETPNQPKIGGRPVDPRDYSSEIVEGFKHAYRLLVANRDELLSDENSPLKGIEDIEVRVIVRDTAFYTLILNESYHPDLLRNALDRDRVLNRVWFGMDIDPVLDSLEDLLGYELADLEQGDVPHFTTTIGSRDLWTSQNVRVPEFLTISGLDMVRSKLRGLSEGDLEDQTTLVEAAFAALTMSSEAEQHSCLPSGPPKEAASREVLLAATSAIADRIVDLAKWEDSRASWIGLRPFSQGWQLRSVNIDLYSGLPGMAIGLAQMAKRLDRQDLQDLAKGTLATLRIELGRIEDYIGFLGAYMGWGGILYTYLYLGILWQDEALLDEAEKLLPRLSDLIDRDDTHDLVFGACGCLPTLLALWRLRNSQPALDLAWRMGRHVVENSRPESVGIGWVTIEPDRALTGFTHGGSGFAWTLSELYRATSDEIFYRAAKDALSFETSVYLEDNKNWPDFRNYEAYTPEDPPRLAVAWCNGAAGIGLSRLRMMRHHTFDGLRQDSENALATTLRFGFGTSHCLCHGDLGNLETLLEASQVLGGEWGGQLERQKKRVLASIDEHGWCSGVPRAFETPGLMEGLTGMAYNLMRLADPEKVPSVLLLDLPNFSPASS